MIEREPKPESKTAILGILTTKYVPDLHFVS